MPKKFIKRPMGVMMARNRKIKDGIITVSLNLIRIVCIAFVDIIMNNNVSRTWFMCIIVHFVYNKC